MCTNLRASFGDLVLCTDASPFGFGCATAPLEPKVVKHLWKYRERRGGYTKLEKGPCSELASFGGWLDADEAEDLAEEACALYAILTPATLMVSMSLSFSFI